MTPELRTVHLQAQLHADYPGWNRIRRPRWKPDEEARHAVSEPRELGGEVRALADADHPSAADDIS
jgi:hypothetical protein